MRAFSRTAAILFLLSFAAPLHAASPTVSGVVVNEAGKPLPGAEVLAVEVGSQSLAGTRARADTAGRLQLTLEDCGPYYLKASAKGFAPALLIVTACNASPDYRFVLTPGATASGTILGANGQPVPGAEVELVRSEVRPASWVGFEDPGPYRATTGPDGRFKISDLPPGKFKLVAAHPKHPRLEQGIDVAEGAPKVELGRFMFRKPQPVEGQVVDPQGRPLAGVRIFFHPYAPDSLTREMAVVTGPDGRFTSPELGDGRPAFCKAGYLPYQILAVRPERISRVVLTPAPPPFRLSGRVLDPEGRPRASARVRISEPVVRVAVDPRPRMACGHRPAPEPCTRDANPPEPTAVSAADGRFSMEIERPALLTFEVVAPGYLRSLPVEVAAGRGGSAEIDFTLRRATVVIGRVFTRDGSPAAGVRISPARILNGPEAFTDSRGRYRLEGIEPGRRDLRAEHPEHGLALGRLVVSTGENPLDFTLDGEPERVVSGRVVDSAGQPLAGVEVGLPSSLLYTAADGGFRAVLGLDLELEETERIYVNLQGYAPVTIPFLPADTPLHGLEIRLAREQDAPAPVPEDPPLQAPGLQEEPDPEPALVLTGSVLEWPEGARARIQAEKGDLHRWADVEPDGTWRLDQLGPGEWKLKLQVGEKDGSVREGEARVRLLPDQPETHFDFDIFFGQGSLSGHLTRGGQPVMAWITLLPPSGDELSARSYGANEDDHDPFRFDDLRPGSYVLKIWDRDYGRTFYRAVEVSGGEEISIDLRK